MKKRTIVAAILLPILLLILLLAPKVITAFVVAFSCAVAAYELLCRTKIVKHVRLCLYSCLFAFLVPIWSFYGMNRTWGNLGLLVFFGLLFMESMLAQCKIRVEKLSICLLGGLVVPYMLSSLVRIHNTELGRYMVMVPLIIAFLSDTGAYFVGVFFGKRKLAPVISPNKTVEGLLGGVLSGVLAMLIYALILHIVAPLKVNFGATLVYGILGSLAGVFGDLCFSVIKRQTGIKDYGNLIPGHGGILDRFDSIVTVAMFVEILYTILPLAVRK